jgi:hypothetical protein
MRLTWMNFALAATLGLAPACLMDEGDLKPDVDDTKGGADGKGEAWSNQDDPRLFSNDLEYRIDQLPLNAQLELSPWAGNYWPTYQDSINYRWAGSSSQSPAAKYGDAFNVSGVENAVSASYGIDRYKGVYTACTSTSECDRAKAEECSKRVGETSGVCIPTWFGICHAWAPAAILVPEPKYDVVHNGVTFKVNDIKALITLAYDRTNTRFVGLRCNLDESAGEIAYDGYGRPVDRECRDSNPGTYHVLMTNYLGLKGQSFIEDRTFDYQVWNQPMRGYRITQQVEVSSEEANRLVGVPATGGQTAQASGTVARNTWSHQAPLAVAAGEAVEVVMTGTADADLYVRFGAQPTTSAYDCRPYANGSNETCSLIAPDGAGQVFVSVRGYADSSDFSVTTTVGGGVSDQYVFNDRAVRFFHVKMEADWITESPAHVDGHLGSTINTYTRTDRYEYVLEIDATGKIIGGEWIGASKRNHPDFLWLPLSHRDSTFAGGKITYANIKLLLDKSLQDPNAGDVVGDDKVVYESGAVVRGQWQHYGPFDVAPGTTLTALMTGTGDADLYVRKGAQPTLQGFDCRPYKNGSSEECSVVGPGAYYVSVHGYANASSAFDLEIRYTEGSGSSDPVEPPPAVVHLDVTDSVAQGQAKHYTIDVVAGRKIVVRTFAPNDVDLYLQMNQAPTLSQYLLRAWTTSGNETLAYTPTSNGTLHIMVHGYAASSFTLRTADN